MYPRFYKPSKQKSFFLFGPRGTGKTTWLKQRFPGAERLDLLNPETARLLLSSPERLSGLVSNKNPTWIILDEVQKVPAVLDEVHRLIEDKGWRFILTGSSARKLRRGGANLLAGRAPQKFFFPLTIWELGEAFDMTRALKYGLLPSLWLRDPEGGMSNQDPPKDYLNTYVYTYLKEEVFAEGLARNLETFSRFLEIMSFSQAQPINMNAIARDVGVDAKVVASYLEVLEDLLLAVRLPVFSKSAKRRMAAHPKFLYFDSGVFRSLRTQGPLDSDSEAEGAALETLFFHHHRALGAFSEWEQTLYFWRTADKKEIDFISYGPLGLFAFEIKRGSIVRDQDLSALRTFKSDFPMAKCYLLNFSDHESFRDDVQIMNFEHALKILPEIFGVSGAVAEL